MTNSMRVPRLAALWAISSLVAASSAASFSESYRGLYIFAHDHGLAGFWAAAFPAQIDVFIAVGELALFVALVDGWDQSSRYAAWAVTGLGLTASVLGNVGHVTSPLLTYRVTAAVPPLAAAASLAVGLGVLKRLRLASDRREQVAQSLLQHARDAYCSADYELCLEFLSDAQATWPPLASQLTKARAAVLVARDGPAISASEGAVVGTS